jgi:tetratricopeptide (TPR) repeat protein
MSEYVARLCLFATFGLLLAATAWLYAPGVHGPALLDDRTSVTLLETDVDSRQRVEQVFGDGSGPLGRPVTMATFVAERALVGDDLRWSKAINIALHLLNGLLLAWLIHRLLRAAGYSQLVAVALLAAGLWLVSPLWVSTVLYAVQRMAMLACTFMLLALIAYTYWRERYSAGEGGSLRLALVLVCAALAVFAKENGVVVLPVLLLLELLWYGCRRAGRVDKGMLYLVLGALVLGGVFVLAVFALAPGRFLGHYALREFTLVERVLTQSRILWDYIGQLVWPEVARMGLYHDDVVLSRSLMHPIATLHALLAWCAALLLAAAVSGFPLGRRVAFCLLLFLVGHSIESTVLPLELYFEHRNYFPGIALFLLLALLLAELAQRWPKVAAPVGACFGLALVALSFNTSSQVEIWANSYLLRFNQINAHPASFRANADMAVMYARAGSLDRALEYSAVAHANSREREGDHYLRNLALSCMAGQPLPASAGTIASALDAPRPLSSVATLHVLVRMLQNEQCTQLDRPAIADAFARVYLRPEAGATASANIYALLAVLENALGRYANAYEYTAQFLAQAPGTPRGLLMQLHFSTALGKVSEAEALKRQLLTLQAAGALTVSDQETLALYLEAD